MTTTPITASESRIPSAGTGPAANMTEEWRIFAAFLRRPTLDVGTKSEGALTVLARIYALDLCAMAVLIGLASLLIAAGVYIPATALAGMEFTLGIVAMVVIGAPVMEEIAFRSWLSGKPAIIAALLVFLAGALGFGLAHMAVPALGLTLAVIGIAGGGASLFFLRNKPTLGWFARGFPVFFWLSTVAFALVHLANFDEGSLGILLPLVLPQFILGSMLGFVRVRFGLWAAIALHAAHNATAVTIAALAGQLS
ncbi:CPBP family intramembrane metalloprotease [Erythrobacter sp. SCSIO 43205]|uniref:CPBP family glutamic-type intramembrane protease n=1 Tax=Erythrobacter sp. SCSIO 43205 TaxID=2779361 RepID=UPI001CA80C7D|nr:CPBP family glutamic-type intramembrane protease [Erythrobacter sp. SCSIO 43205]UAB78247.1 CPBP family intramembrane metalloprotease [Erythrobacter sp. SCSIO 43205]